MGRLVFSGHETFTCKQFWLKKGYDYLQSGKKFSDKTAVVDLGVGKNMVQSIKFWMNAFGISENKEDISELGSYLFGKKSNDLFLEDVGSIWLLHYFLVKQQRASIYNLVFNEYRSTKNGFTKGELHTFLKKKCESTKGTNYTPNTIDRDIGVFINNYLKPSKKESEIEAAYSGLLHELNLLQLTQKERITIQENLKKKREFEDWYYFDVESKESLPYQVVLFAIMDNPLFGNTVSFNDLLLSENSPGRVFVINAETLYNKIEQMVQHHKEITYSKTAGNRVLQIDSSLNKWDILDGYYL